MQCKKCNKLFDIEVFMDHIMKQRESCIEIASEIAPAHNAEIIQSEKVKINKRFHSLCEGELKSNSEIKLNQTINESMRINNGNPLIGKIFNKNQLIMNKSMLMQTKKYNSVDKSSDNFSTNETFTNKSITSKTFHPLINSQENIQDRRIKKTKRFVDGSFNIYNPIAKSLNNFISNSQMFLGNNSIKFNKISKKENFEDVIHRIETRNRTIC